MTYLHCPRFHFAGSFVAEPSTVNNDPAHYALALAAGGSGTPGATAYRARFWTSPGGWWNPHGGHAFRFQDVTVTSAVGSDGTVAAGDAVVAMRLGTRGTSPAKLVDLDTDQQLVSTIYGLHLVLRDAGGAVLLDGRMAPAAFSDIWRRGTTGSGDEAASAAYQSTMTVTWGDLTASPFLGQLRAAAGDGVLSIKFTVDGYAMNPASPHFRRGRIVGTVGVAAAGEPAHTVVGRQFGTEEFPPGADPGLRPESGINFFPGVVDAGARRIRLDLGNALPVATAGGPTDDLGELVLSCRADDGTVTRIAAVDYRSDATWYPTTAGIVDVPADRELTDDEVALVTGGRLLLVAHPGGQEVTVEEADVHVRADEFVARLDPGGAWVVRLHVSRRGAPVAARVDLFLLLPEGADAAAHFPVGGLTFPESVESGADGVAEVTLTAADPGDPRFFYLGFDAVPPGSRRGQIDGQVYRIGYAVDGVAAPNSSNHLSALVWGTFAPAEHPPTWHGSIGPLLIPYGNLYPSMTDVGLDLADYDQVADQADQIVDVLGLPVDDPHYMPVTRDLSGSRRAAIVAWLQNPGPDGRPLLGVAPAPGGGLEQVEPAEPGIDLALGGKTIAGMRTGIVPPER